MAKNKIIFKSNQTPNSTDLSVGELIINVTDRKIFSKDKNNVVFEIQGGTGDSTNSYISSSFENNIITFNQGDGSTDQIDLTSIINASGDDDWFIDAANGRITASLNVYVDGDITGSSLKLGTGNQSAPAIVFGNSSPNTGIYSAAPDNLSFQIDGGTVEFNIGPTQTKLITPKFIVESNITASGNISASGNVIMDGARVFGTAIVNSHITGAANISASGFVAAELIKLADNHPLPTAEKGIIIYSASSFYAGIE